MRPAALALALAAAGCAGDAPCSSCGDGGQLADLGSPGDLAAAPIDLASAPADLAGPADLAQPPVDLALGCQPKTVNGVLCGCQGLPCCPGGVGYGSCNNDGLGCFLIASQQSNETCQPCGAVGQPCCPTASGQLPTCSQGAECLSSNSCNTQSNNQASPGCFNCDVQGCGVAGHVCCYHQPNGILCPNGGTCTNGIC